MKIHTLILDRSGSMSSIWNEITSAVNSHIKQKSSDALCSTLLFDDYGLEYLYKYEYNPKPLNKDNFNPRGNTPLRDAIMYGIETLTKDWRDFLYQDFVEVEFVIFTDGEENASKFWKTEDVSRAINHFQTEYGWKFTFIGQGKHSEVEKYAKGFGIKTENIISYQHNNELEKVFAKI